ncbi:hypothetical protein [Abyssisolibacter fermentans]|uniref:hypothetical protein n=1 Tax=Abyssisolibacter fermentans TaxID=1766203 RepID=UPI000837A091|nr:hypothetical protein [Abyssisolibacter fermentans]
METIIDVLTFFAFAYFIIRKVNKATKGQNSNKKTTKQKNVVRNAVNSTVNKTNQKKKTRKIVNQNSSDYEERTILVETNNNSYDSNRAISHNNDKDIANTYDLSENINNNNKSIKSEPFLSFNKDDVIKGIIMSEILGKPKSLKRLG